MSPRPHNKLDRHLGIRGWILLLCAAAWWLVGLAVVLRANRDGDPSLLHLYIPEGLRVVGWWGGAALAIYGAFWKRHLPVVTSVLVIMPIIRVASYLWGWITYLVPGPPMGYANGWYTAVFHLLMIGLVLIAAHTKEPTRDEVK